jgi:AcrR family transcriptional regulator
MTGQLNTRDRMVMSAALLMREQGVEATSFSRVLEHSGAPRGSIYHHFPGGKTQMIEEATRFGGDFIVALLTRALEEGDSLTALEASEGFWQTVLRESNYGAGCPVVAATLEGDRTPSVRDAAGEVFKRWEDLVADGLRRHGVPRERAQSLGAFVFAAIEGAAIIARARQSIEPLERVFDELRAVLSGALREAAGEPDR